MEKWETFFVFHLFHGTATAIFMDLFTESVALGI